MNFSVMSPSCELDSAATPGEAAPAALRAALTAYAVCIAFFEWPSATWPISWPITPRSSSSFIMSIRPLYTRTQPLPIAHALTSLVR